MTDTTHNELNEAGLSRRRALQAGVGAGVGLVAWSGATITSIHGTPAYAAVCTQFTYQFESTDMSTNQSSGCATFSYNNSPPLAVKAGAYDWTVPGGGNFACADSAANCYTFTFPATDKCRLTIKVHKNKYRDSTVVFGKTTDVTSDDGVLEFCLPSAPFSAEFMALFNASPANTFWSVFITCISENSGSGCDLPTP